VNGHIWTIARTFGFEKAALAQAIGRTLARRGTDFPADIPLALTPAFAAMPAKIQMWERFLRRSRGRSSEPPLSLDEIVGEIRAFLGRSWDRSRYPKVPSVYGTLAQVGPNNGSVGSSPISKRVRLATQNRIASIAEEPKYLGRSDSQRNRTNLYAQTKRCFDLIFMIATIPKKLSFYHQEIVDCAGIAWGW
jgi:hypothetical protein